MTTTHDRTVLRHFRSDAIRLLRPVWPLVAAMTALGSVAGLATAAALAKINAAFHWEEGTATGVLLAFAAFAALSVFGSFVASCGNALAGGRIQAALSRDLIDRVLTAPIERIERVGKPKLLASLQGDVRTIGSAVTYLSSLTVAIGTLVGCIVTMAMLSPALTIVTVLVLAAEVVAENALRRDLDRTFDRSRDIRETVQKHQLTVIDAAKELRIGRERRLRLRHVDLPNCFEEARRIGMRLANVVQAMSTLSQAVNFLLFAGLIAFKDWTGMSGAALSGFALVLLYLQRPISEIIHFLPTLSEARTAYRRIAAFADGGGQAEPNLLAPEMPGQRRLVHDVTLRGVSHTFPAEDGGAPFVLGPIDLSIRSGEILFIVGENGSGKTTLIKLLLGLYPPQTGEILLDGVAVTAQTRDAYRQLFSAIFFDFHLFADLIVPEDGDLEAARRLMRRLDLDHKVDIVEGRFTTVDLSTGQRKRLALVQTVLEGRPILVLDEWAAEQDPSFRRRFYEELVPELRRDGRTLVVISHDDRYFGAADRVLHLRDGRIAEITGSATAVMA